MHTDGGFIQHIQHPGQIGPQLRCQLDPLRFTARKRRGAAVQCQILQAHIYQETEPPAQLTEQLLGTWAFDGAQLEMRHEICDLMQRP